MKLNRLFAFFFIFTVAASARGADGVESRIDELLSRMSLEEKIGQTALRGMSSRHEGPIPDELKETVRGGHAGAFLNVMIKDNAAELQRIAVEESPNGIPLLFARDVIHGFRTVFPIPLGQAASWNPDMAERAARLSAVEASSYGIRWTFAPMMDITRDPRWGRIAESFGEDPYLSEVFAEAMVKGFQTDDLSAPDSLAATAKHYAGYGAAEGGRDYNTTWIPEPLMRNLYLRPFHAAVRAGAATLMTGFNDVNGIPATGNRFLLTDVLRDEWGFDGFVVSDWDSLVEMIPHGYARDKAHAAERAANAGLDMEMTSTAYEEHLAELIRAGKVSEEQLDRFVRRILRVKFRLGLFEEPYFDEQRDTPLLSDKALEAARQAAVESFVMLKNNNDVLPLAADQKIALVGPMADAPHDQLGTWTFDGKAETSRTPLQALRETAGDKLVYEPTLEVSRTRSRKHFDAAVEAARDADVTLVFAGEEAILSGEAHSRADIRLPGAQEALIETVSSTGTPVVLVVMSGRPNVLHDVLEHVDAVLVAWHPGTMAGPALADVLYGKASPSGRLPVTWPKAVGQIPIYYNHKNTGRPPNDEDFVQMYDIPVGAWQSSLGNDAHYLDIGFRPEFPFGYGLSYADFEYSNLSVTPPNVGKPTHKSNRRARVSVDVTNTGDRAGDHIVEVYNTQSYGSVMHRDRRVVGYERVEALEPGETRTVEVALDLAALEVVPGDVPALDPKVVEAGEYELTVGELTTTLTVRNTGSVTSGRHVPGRFDVNRDGELTIEDVLLIYKYSKRREHEHDTGKGHGSKNGRGRSS
jgi:beta-glucosidase